jgi:hypothetical protein
MGTRPVRALEVTQTEQLKRRFRQSVLRLGRVGEKSFDGAFMAKMVSSILVATLAASSLAEARPSTTTMSCGQAAATVAKAGAIVLTTGPNTYERFVASNAQCLPGEITEAAQAPTTDSPSCTVGYVCKQREQYEDSSK